MTIAKPALLFCLVAALQGATDSTTATPTFKQYCFSCHGKAAMAGLNLEELIVKGSVGHDFHHWEKVATALEQKRMPPKKMPQPSDAERRAAVSWIRAKLNEYAVKHAGDPGRVTVRRLTSGEYTYTINDLTGLDLKFDRDFASDSVGGEGFTNFGDVQFMDDANLERYLEAAKRIADHAVIGSGPLEFFEHPGKSGLELSAVARIQEIYRAHGFRSVAGEGAKQYGLDRYGKAFYTAWRYLHREALGENKATLEQLAAREGISARFAQHIWSLLNQPSPQYPVSDVAARWRSLPAPAGPEGKQTAVRAACEDLQHFVVDWTRALFAAGPMESAVGDDRVFLLTDESLKVQTKQNLRFVLRGRGQKTARVYLTVASVNPNAKDKPYVSWRNGSIRALRGRPGQAAAALPAVVNRREGAPLQPLKPLLSEDTVARLAYNDNDFSIAPGTTMFIDVPFPEGAFGVELQFDVTIPAEGSGDAVLRATISDKEEVGKGRTTPVLLGHPGSPGYEAWKAGLLAFSEQMPQNSHGEPTPSDRDPIPPPFDTSYNQPERDHYHIKLKYYRSDRFLVEKILDDATRLRLDHAWNDLLSSFEYHNLFLRFVAQKYKLDLKKGISELNEDEIAAIPADPRKYVAALRADYDSIMKAQRAARQGHVEDSVRLASKAWRRPLSKVDEESLRAFYRRARTTAELDHAKAIRSLLARILIAPAFLYRLEQPAKVASDKPLSNWELAGRLSFFLWASIPDDELRRSAAAGELTNPQHVERQVKRMLADPKARRLSTEFFGQWLGFYRFDQYRGVDTMRYPEFTDDVKTAMHEEAVAFFEHIVRKDRPIREMFFADYTFLNKALAKHYGAKKEIAITSSGQPELVADAGAIQRGGLLRLGAVLTVTSAPLRTSPVKRGDWLLRRVLGTPTPPPPADAGSIPADDKSFGGLTVFERLEAHKRNPTCASCHTRIDPLGFPLERYDAVGRWRDTYADGKPIQDSASFADQTQISGIDGLLKYIQSQEKQVLRTFSAKLLGYALGRTILASDQPLIDRLTAGGWDVTFSKLASEIVGSRQFRYRREPEEPTSVRTLPKEGGL